VIANFGYHIFNLKHTIMKSIFLLFSLAANILMIGVACKKNEAAQARHTATAANDTKALGTVAQQVIKCTDCTVDDLAWESAGEFANVVGRYRTTHQELFNNFAKGMLNSSVYPNLGSIVNNNFQDARTCWFGLDRIKKYICLLEHYAGMIGIPSTKLGMRFYYGVYPSNYQRDVSLSNKHTLFIASTYEDEIWGHVDFDPRKSTGGGGIVTLGDQVVNNEPLVFVMSAKAATNQQNPNPTLNQGDLCPPGNSCSPTLNAVDGKVPVRPLDPTVYY
jgi:hypothetical protein